MAWNKEKIENTLNELHRRILSVSEEPLLSSLILDYELLLKVLKIIDSETYIYYAGLNPKHVDSGTVETFKDESFQAYFQRKSELLNVFQNFNAKNIRIKNFWTFKSIPEDIYMDMVLDFFQQYDMDHYKLFVKLLNDNIMFTNKKSDLPNACGTCFRLYNSNESYILVYSHNRKNISTLPHEIGHAYEFSLIPDFFQQLNWCNSSFAESYPKFLELLFLYKYVDSEYNKIILNHLINEFYNLKLLIEDHYYLFFNMPRYDVQKNQIIDKYGEIKYKRSLDLIISDLLAFYMLSLYRYDKESFEQFMSQYNLQKGLSDNGIWELFKVSDLEKSLNDELNILCRTLNSSKK